MLRFVVERSLHGLHEPVKERTLGIEVFGREPDYDTNLDPVVRTSAVEIRKRIVQYYADPAHTGEARIDLPPGSYIPEFHLPVQPPVLEPEAAFSHPPVRPLPRLWLRWAALAGLLLAAATVWTLRQGGETTIETFWAPMLNGPDPVSIYIGGYLQDKPGEPVTLTDLHSTERVAFSDATALARVTSWISRHDKSYRFRLQPTANLEDLKDGPAVLIGGFNNSWALRLTRPLPYSFVRDVGANVSRIKDSKDPGNLRWSHQMDAPFSEVAEDYAIISRVIDPATGRMVITASGLAKFGTEAAGEFLTSAEALEEGLRSAPPDWHIKNLQLIIATTPVGRRAGPPRVIASRIW
jgi:hypothetical protein